MKMQKLVVMAGLLLLLGVWSCESMPKQKTEETNTEEMGLTNAAWTKNANIYEVNIRQYTPEGTFNAFEKELPRLKAMGVDILWLMPIFPIGEENRKGTLGSYYAVADYLNTNPEFGTLDDLKSLVSAAHAQGMYVILDWVANHSAWDCPWAAEHPEWYKHDSTGAFVSPFDWTDVIAFDYSNDQMREHMTNAMKFWVSEADVDGFRCDVAGMVPVDFWNDTRKQLDAIKPVFMLAEDEDKVELMDQAFDMNYGWTFHHVMNKIAQGKEPASAIWDYIDWNDSTFTPQDYRMLFITNHDENSWNGTVDERMGDAGEAMAVLTYTMPGMPLIYSGQEYGLTKRLEFFEKDPIDWSNDRYSALYTKLNQLKKEQPALANGEEGGMLMPLKVADHPEVIAFAREKDGKQVIALFNLSDAASSFDLELPAPATGYVDYFTGTPLEVVAAGNHWDLDPWGYQVLVSE